MKVINSLLFLLVTAAGVGVAQAQVTDNETGVPRCYTNCVEVARSGDSLLFFARDREGNIVDTSTVVLPAGARRVSALQGNERIQPAATDGSGTPRSHTTGQSFGGPQSGLPVGTICAGAAGVCTEHSSLTYETPTHFVIVTVTFFFFDGELQDIDVDETRLAKNKVK